MKKIFILFTIIFFTSFNSIAYAANPAMSIRPGSGKVVSGKSFTVDILIDTEGKSLSLARAVIKFDPTLLSITKAQRNESLFCTYPEDEQSIDNENGLLMLTGFCQSGVGNPYKTSGEADVFARVTFKALRVGSAKLDWQYSGEDVAFKSVMMKDGSPPQNILSSKPRQSTFTIVKAIGTTPTPSPVIPNTGIAISAGFVGGGLLLVALGFGYVKWVDNNQKNKLRTVVVYGSSKK